MFKSTINAKANLKQMANLMESSIEPTIAMMRKYHEGDDGGMPLGLVLPSIIHKYLHSQQEPEKRAHFEAHLKRLTEIDFSGPRELDWKQCLDTVFTNLLSMLEMRDAEYKKVPFDHTLLFTALEYMRRFPDFSITYSTKSDGNTNAMMAVILSDAYGKDALDMFSHLGGHYNHQSAKYGTPIQLAAQNIDDGSKFIHLAMRHACTMTLNTHQSFMLHPESSMYKAINYLDSDSEFFDKRYTDVLDMLESVKAKLMKIKLMSFEIAKQDMLDGINERIDQAKRIFYHTHALDESAIYQSIKRPNASL